MVSNLVWHGYDEFTINYAVVDADCVPHLRKV